MTDSPWNSLEIAKIIASLISPILVLVLGIVINNSIRKSERSTALRGEIYKIIGDDLIDIYSYLEFVGDWRKLTPLEIFEKRMAIEKAMYKYMPFLSDELNTTYKHFMNEAFTSYCGAGIDAKIRSDIKTKFADRTIHSKVWEKEWESCFTEGGNKLEQRRAYNDFINQLARYLKL